MNSIHEGKVWFLRATRQTSYDNEHIRWLQCWVDEQKPTQKGGGGGGAGVRRVKCFAILGQPLLAGLRWARPQWDATDGMGRETKR